MSPDDSFKPFGIVTVIICLPTYMLILSLNTTRGLEFWREKTRALFRYIAGAITFLFRSDKKRLNQPGDKTLDTSGDDGGYWIYHSQGKQSC